MSRAPRDAYHAARLLQNELARIAGKRERQIGRANGEFQLELMHTVAGAERPTLALVVQVLREDASQMHLTRALETLLGAESKSANDERRDTEPPPFELRRPAPLPERMSDGGPGLLEPLPASAYAPGATALEPIDAEFEEAADDELPQGYRYPEPGEPAIELPDGRIVADTSGPPP
jgi:hypothetical protein